MDARRPFAVVLVLAVGVCGSMAHAAPIDVTIVSDASWRSNDTLVAGWQTLAFDDTGWPFARAPYPQPGIETPQDLIPGTTAQHMWHDPEALSNGTTGSVEAFFRKTFNLALAADSLPLVGQALINVDDDYELYVNGLLAFENKDGGAADQVDFVDFTDFLHTGTNLFAIHAVDGRWGAPGDRIYERVLFDARIRTLATVPEPYSLGLVAIGLIGWRITWRNKSPAGAAERAATLLSGRDRRTQGLHVRWPNESRGPVGPR